MVAAMLQATMLASDAGIPDGGAATPPKAGGGGSSEDDADEEPAAAVQGMGQRARAAAAAAQALAEEPQATGRFKQSSFYIPHARFVGLTPPTGTTPRTCTCVNPCRGQGNTGSGTRWTGYLLKTEAM
jgi:hypothetical protein